MFSLQKFLKGFINLYREKMGKDNRWISNTYETISFYLGISIVCCGAFYKGFLVILISHFCMASVSLALRSPLPCQEASWCFCVIFSWVSGFTILSGPTKLTLAQVPMRQNLERQRNDTNPAFPCLYNFCPKIKIRIANPTKVVFPSPIPVSKLPLEPICRLTEI